MTIGMSKFLIKKKILIKDFSWICANSFVGPGCTVGREQLSGHVQLSF